MHTANLRIPELLAPAGDWDALRAAVMNGADAVYFGLQSFNARYRATNFADDNLDEVMAELHRHNVRGFVTFNTLIFSDELEYAAELIQKMCRARVDAVIVQDLGLLTLLGALCPALEVHASTQMTLTEPRGIEFVRRLGVRRVVLARELAVSDIQKITSGTAMPLEVFIHGALCVSYSGQCLTSEAIGGRSANRGQCAQACRLPYQLMVDGVRRELGDVAYLLSPQDLAGYDVVGQLAELGVASLKIEGRLKAPHYVAATTQTYRAALDAAAQRTPFHMTDEQYRQLAQSFSRGFAPGFLGGVNHQQLVAGRFPKSRGLRLGTVTGVDGDGVLVQVDADLPRDAWPKCGDGVVFDEGHPDQDEQGGRLFAVHAAGRGSVRLGFARGAVNTHALARGALVWKTDDPAVRRQLETTFSRDRVARPEPIDARLDAPAGGALTLTLIDRAGHEASASWPGPLELARKHPLTLDAAREQLARLGDTPLALRELTATRLDAVMVPKSVLNELRRQAVESLLDVRANATCIEVREPLALARLRHEIAERYPPSCGDPPAASTLHILCRTLEQLQAVVEWRSAEPGVLPGVVLCDFEDLRRYKPAVPLARSAGRAIGLATLRILKPTEDGLNRLIADAEPDYVLIRNLGSLAYFREHLPGAGLLGDYSLNVANELTAAVLLDHGLSRLVPSYDLNFAQLQAMLGKVRPERFELVLHQHMPMFHTEHCVFAHTLSTGKDYRDCGRPCEKHQVDLQDREGVLHPLIPDTGCRNTVYNGTAQSAAELTPRLLAAGIRHFRVELLRERADAVLPLLDRYARVLAGREEGRQAVRSLRVLNQLGVTAGTFVHA